MKRLYFLRHGLSIANKLGIVSGRTEHALAPEGKKQARKAGQDAKNLDIDIIVSSPQSRALATAKIFAKEIGYSPKKIIVNSLFVERDFGDFEGRQGVLPQETLAAIYTQGINGSESDKEVLIRARQAFDWLETQDAENILVVSHGSFGRSLRKIAKIEHDFYEKIPNAELVCWVDND